MEMDICKAFQNDVVMTTSVTLVAFKGVTNTDLNNSDV